MTSKEKKNILISILLMCPASLFNEMQDGIAPALTVGFILTEWITGLIVSGVIAAIIFGIRFWIFKKGSFFTTYYKTTYIFCVLIISVYPLGFLFGRLFN